MKISSLLEPESILVNISVSDKQELIETLVDTLEHRYDSQLVQSFKQAVIDRENLMSTGVGKGLAIPHAKIADFDDNIAVFATLENPIDFGSVDDKPVNAIFLLIGGTQKASIHIKLLSRISRIMNNDDFRAELLQAESEEEVLTLFREEEDERV